MSEERNPNTPMEPWELRAELQSTRDFRAELEKERAEFQAACRAIPEIQRETERQSVALFSTDENNSVTGMLGLVPIMRELTIGWRIVRKMVPWFWAAVVALVSLGGTIIGMLYEIAKSGVFKVLP